MTWKKRPWQRSARKASRLSVLCVLAALLSGFAYGLSVSDRPSDPVALGWHAGDPLDEISQKFALPGLGERRIETIATSVERAAEACARIESLVVSGLSPGDTAERIELRRLFAVLSHSPLARKLIEQARSRNTVICIDANTELLGYYRAGIRLIGLRASLNESEKIAYLAHELTHGPQHSRFSDNRYFPTADLILLRRVREATAEATATWIAWELRQAGFPAVWREKRADHFYGDVAEAFEQAWHDLSGPNRDICAARAAFDQWFAAPARLSLYDRMTVEHLERISGDHLGLVRPNLSLTHGFLVGIGKLGERNFLTQVPGRWLTHAHYTDGLSVQNARRLDDLFAAAAASRVGPAGPRAISALPQNMRFAENLRAHLPRGNGTPGLIR